MGKYLYEKSNHETYVWDKTPAHMILLIALFETRR